LEYVGGQLDLAYTDIESLSGLKYVGHSLLLDECSDLQSIGELKFIGGDLSIEGVELFNDYTEEQIRNMVEVTGEIYR